METHSSILARRIPVNGGAWWATVYGVARSWTWLSTHTHMQFVFCVCKVAFWTSHAEVLHSSCLGGWDGQFTPLSHSLTLLAVSYWSNWITFWITFHFRRVNSMFLTWRSVRTDRRCDPWLSSKVGLGAGWSTHILTPETPWWGIKPPCNYWAGCRVWRSYIWDVGSLRTRLWASGDSLCTQVFQLHNLGVGGLELLSTGTVTDTRWGSQATGGIQAHCPLHRNTSPPLTGKLGFQSTDVTFSIAHCLNISHGVDRMWTHKG